MNALILSFACALVTCDSPTDVADARLSGFESVGEAQPASSDTVLSVTADTWLRQGHPNRNQGEEDILRVRRSGRNRALLQVDPSVLTADVSADIEAWLASETNAGWIVKKANEGQTGRVEFGRDHVLRR